MAISVFGPATAQEFTLEAGSLSVYGEATAHAPNTTAVVNFGVKSRASTPGEALAMNNKTLTRAFKKLKELQIDDADIQTSNINLSEWFDHDIKRNNGFEVTNIVRVQVQELEVLGDLLTQVTDSGVNWIRFSHMAPAKDAIDKSDLRKEAAENARKKANLYAEALNLEIIGIISVSEPNEDNYPTQMSAMAKIESSSMPISGGDSSFKSGLNVTYFVKLAEQPFRHMHPDPSEQTPSQKLHR
jgi:uncharacterized protein YggE